MTALAAGRERAFGIGLGGFVHRHRRREKVQIADAVRFNGGLCLGYSLTPAPDGMNDTEMRHEGTTHVTIDGIACPAARSTYRLAADGREIVGTLLIPIEFYESCLVHVRFTPMARTPGFDADLCEALLQVRVSEVQPICVRWVRH